MTSLFDLLQTAPLSGIRYNELMGERVATGTARSLRTAVVGLIADFANGQGITCGLTHQAMSELVFALAAYREEETPLFPEVYVTTAPTTLPALSAVHQRLLLGSGAAEPGTVRRALKICAALATNGWAMFLERTPTGFEFGVFRISESLLSLTAADMMVAPEPLRAPVILLRNSKANCVELIGRDGGRLDVRLTSEIDVNEIEESAPALFAARICQGLEEDFRDAALRYFTRVIADACRGSHGALLAVLARRRREIPAAFSDGVLLRHPIDLGGLLVQAHRAKDIVTCAELETKSSLLRGMVRSDGVTLLSPDAKVLGFRIFIKATQKELRQFADVGGARTRAFAILKRRCPRELDSALMWSQDGRTEFAGGHDE